MENPKRDENVRLKIPDGVRVQNKRGEWVPAIPEPYGTVLNYKCTCGRSFVSYEKYQGHYALKHILAL